MGGNVTGSPLISSPARRAVTSWRPVSRVPPPVAGAGAGVWGVGTLLGPEGTGPASRPLCGGGVRLVF